MLVALAVVLGVPFALRPAVAPRSADHQPTLIVVTPHVQQIRREFEQAFDRWHQRRYGHRVHIDWRTPGGTAEIIRQLEAQYLAALKQGRFDLSDPDHPRVQPGTIGVDVVFGGGSFDHTRLKRGVLVTRADGSSARVPMSVSAGFASAQLEAWYGDNRIGNQPLYDPDQHWLGTALSSFGIIYNREVLATLGLPAPTAFCDLADPRYAGWLALADPRHSASVATTFEAILNFYGWERGWRLLREITANARYFTNASTRPPIDVAAGEAAAGLAIDFYGRSQAHAIARPGQTPFQTRVRYVDPADAPYVDADPVSILRGGPNPDLARRFVEFCLSEEGQALWSFRPRMSPARDASDAASGSLPDPLGPHLYALHRLPVRRIMYEKYLSWFVDPVNPFAMARETPARGWRSALGVMMGAFAIDIADEQRAAWAALNRARGDGSFPPDRLTEMERLFYAFPDHPLADGRRLPFTEANFALIEADAKAWCDPVRTARLRVTYTNFFRRAYARVVELGAAGRGP